MPYCESGTAAGDDGQQRAGDRVREAARARHRRVVRAPVADHEVGVRGRATKSGIRSGGCWPSASTTISASGGPRAQERRRPGRHGVALAGVGRQADESTAAIADRREPAASASGAPSSTTTTSSTCGRTPCTTRLAHRGAVARDDGGDALEPAARRRRRAALAARASASGTSASRANAPWAISAVGARELDQAPGQRDRRSPDRTHEKKRPL